ncbi:MAG: hypothetical protein ABEJ61_10415 [Haloferacaceae archaeon]
MAEHATRVTVSHPDELSDWGRRQLYADRFRTYLRRVHDEVAVGDEWDEFLDVGCCGGSLDLTLRVEAVEGPDRIGPDTEVEFAERTATVTDEWEVGSVAGGE